MRFLLDQRPKKDSLLVQLVEGESEDLVIDQGVPKLILGLGKQKGLTTRRLMITIRRAIQSAKAKKKKEIFFNLSDPVFTHLSLTPDELGELFAVNTLLADYSFDAFKSRPPGGFPHVGAVGFRRVADRKAFRRGLRRGRIIGEETNAARHIATMPASEMTPELLAYHARNVVADLPVSVTVWDEADMEKRNFRGILTVGKGSTATPRFILLEYRGAGEGKKAAPVVLIGKGVTFDSGGINLKPTDAILGMNMDMSGAAAVIHTLAACAKLEVPQPIVVLVPAVENMISGESYRPGDIIRTLSGKTIEVQNTDAEGRIILADTLTFAKSFAPSLVIDVATLTGAALVALGERTAALFTEDEHLESDLLRIGVAVGDPVWPLPLWEEYFEDIKGTYGDVGNVGNTKWGGAITAAMFLKQFVAYPWAHIDIAPRMLTLPSDYLAKGSAGAGVQLLVHYLLEQAKG